MSNRLILKDTKLVKLTKFPGENGATQVLSVRSLLTRTLAGQLKCHDSCFAESGVPRRFDRLKINEVIDNCEVECGSAGILLANQASHFTIGRAKEATETDPSLEVSLSLHLAGSAQLNDWFDTIARVA